MRHVLKIYDKEFEHLCSLEIDLPTMMTVPITVYYPDDGLWEFEFDTRTLRLDDLSSPYLEVYTSLDKGEDLPNDIAPFLVSKGWTYHPPQE